MQTSPGRRAPTCVHGAVKRTSHTVRNPNRDFWCCSLPRDRTERCDYFVWADEASVAPSSTPSTIQHPSQSPNAKRFLDIQKGLQERPGNRIDTVDHESSSTDEESSVPQAPPLFLTGPSSSIIQERELPSSSQQPVPRRSLLGLDSPVMAPAEFAAVPASPPSQNQSSGGGSSMLLTPPTTVPRSANGFVSVDAEEPASPTLNKGKGRAVVNSMGGSVENEENPFLERPPAFNVALRADSTSNLLKFLPASSSGSPSRGEQIMTVFNRVKLAEEDLHTNIMQLQELGAVDYLLKTERQKNSFRIGNDAKADRIAELTAEVNALKREVQELKKSNHEKDQQIDSLLNGW